MKNLFLLVIMLSFLFFACKDNFEDFDSRTVPPPSEITISIPEYLNFTIYHSVIPDSTLTQNAIFTEIEALNISGNAISDIKYLVSIYKDSNFTIDNLIFTKKINVQSLDISEKTEKSFLAENLPPNLQEEQIEIQLISAQGVNCSTISNSYQGSYTLKGIVMADSIPTAIGNLSGYINCLGNYSFRENAGAPISLVEGFINADFQTVSQIKIGSISYNLNNVSLNNIEQNSDTIRINLFPDIPIAEHDSIYEINLEFIPN